MNPTVLSRPATIEDADAIGALALQFQAYLRGLGDTTDFVFTAATYRRDGFGPNPAFKGIVAEVEGALAGYLLYMPGYDTDRALRQLFIIDLYVADERRRIGIGGILMKQAAVVARNQGAGEMVWAVFHGNTLAKAFYEGLGARYVENLQFMFVAV